MHWSIGEIAIAVILIVAIVAIVAAAAKGMGYAVPPWVWHIAGIVIVASVAIAAIRFLLLA